MQRGKINMRIDSYAGITRIRFEGPGQCPISADSSAPLARVRMDIIRQENLNVKNK